MKKFIASLLMKLSRKLHKEPDIDSLAIEKIKSTDQVASSTIEKWHIADQAEPRELKPKKVKGPKLKTLSPEEKAVRDITEMMEVPFLALSKKRITPIIYEKHNGSNMIRVKVSRHTDHFLASIYDWDIVLFVAGKMQEILNSGSDIPPRTMIFPRYELFKALKRHDGEKQKLDLKAALSRLQSTLIRTTIRNEDGRYDAGFGFLESWSYTKRKDIKEIKITLSEWLYDGICAKGSLLMVDPGYFNLTSALKRFLYRTARKHVGGHGKSWEFLIETLYEKSGSEQEFRFFKRDLREAVLENDVPGFFLEWIEKDHKTFISFKNLRKSSLLMSVSCEVDGENLSP